jgi:hypothetical protein
MQLPFEPRRPHLSVHVPPEPESVLPDGPPTTAVMQARFIKRLVREELLPEELPA